MYKSLAYIKRITHLISSRLLTLNFVGWPRPRAFSAMTTKFMCLCVCVDVCVCVWVCYFKAFSCNQFNILYFLFFSPVQRKILLQIKFSAWLIEKKKIIICVAFVHNNVSKYYLHELRKKNVSLIKKYHKKNTFKIRSKATKWWA